MAIRKGSRKQAGIQPSGNWPGGFSGAVGMAFLWVLELFNEHNRNVMVSLPKHLYRFVATALISTAVEMLRQAHHDVLFNL
ncbi:hypothetical protein EI291_04040 [Hymenobacter rigui]|uniref:Uncharacterized protein n=2 Tax=Hymenobacter rigui TaxID=334424 RepID=A0A3R9N773_9BACT|nr:hypothetical protein EI291_04040 [Hymenobacter rigui]